MTFQRPIRAVLAVFVAVPVFLIGCSQREKPLATMTLSVFRNSSEQELSILGKVELRDGWHTYWLNPGESGLPPRLNWRDPPGAAISDVRFPAPERIQEDHLTTFGYKDSMIFLASVDSSAEGEVVLYADLLVCQDVCLPVSCTATVSLERPEPSKPSLSSWSFPTPIGADSIASDIRDNRLTLSLHYAGEPDKTPQNLFPQTQGIVRIDTVAAQSSETPSITISAPLAQTAYGTTDFRGIITFEDGTSRHFTTTLTIPSLSERSSK